MTPPNERVRAELDGLIAEASGRLGEVHRLTKRGLNPDQIAKELGVSTSGFVSNNRIIATSILEGSAPGGATMADQVASRVRSMLRIARLSDEARAYLMGLLPQLGHGARSEPTRVRAARVGVSTDRTGDRGRPNESPLSGDATRNLREEVHRAVRRRCELLIARIASETSIEPTDYHRTLVARFAMDAVYRLIVPNATSATSRALSIARRTDLTLESAVLQWAADLPIGDDLVESARARMDWWHSND